MRSHAPPLRDAHSMQLGRWSVLWSSECLGFVPNETARWRCQWEGPWFLITRRHSFLRWTLLAIENESTVSCSCNKRRRKWLETNLCQKVKLVHPHAFLSSPELFWPAYWFLTLGTASRSRGVELLRSFLACIYAWTNWVHAMPG
jgi:hypothetical protein